MWRVTRSFLSGILTFSIVTLPFPAAATVGQWQEPVNLTIPSVETSDQYPQVVVDSTGLVTAVWTHVESNGSVIQSSTSRNGGAWSNPVNLSTVGLSADGAELVVDHTGLVTAIWQTYRDRRFVIQSSTRQRGGTWSEPVDVSVASSTRDSNAPKLAVDSFGLVTAVWHSTTGSSCVIESRDSQSGGQWSDIVEVASAEPGECYYFPQISTDPNGFVTAIWNRYHTSAQGSGSNIMSSSTYRVNNTAVRAWSNPESLSIPMPGVYDQNPQVLTDTAGLTTAIWFSSDYSNPGNSTFQSSMKNNNSRWTSPVITSGSDAVSTARLTVESSGLVTATWVGKSETVLQSRTSHGNEVWSDQTEVFSGYQIVDFDTRVDSTGLVTAIWIKQSNENASILVSQFKSGQGWSTPLVLLEAEPGSFLSNVQLTENPSQLPTAIYMKSFDESQYVVQSITFGELPATTPTTAPASLSTLAVTGSNYQAGIVGFGLAAILVSSGAALIWFRRRLSI